MRIWTHEQRVLILFLAPAVLILAVTQFWPLVYSARLSLIDWTLARSPRPGPFVGLANYAKALHDPVFIDSVGVTAVYALTATALEIVIGLALALALVGERFAVKLSRTILILPMVIAPVAVGTMWRMMLSAQAGPINHLLGLLGIDGPDWLGDPDWALVSVILIDVWEWTPFVMVIYVAVLTALPEELSLAAKVDGASRWQVLRHVVLPLMMPVSVLVVMFRLIDAILTLDVIVTTTFGGPGYRTYTLSFWIYQQGLRYFNVSYAAATSWLLLGGCLTVAVGLLLWRRCVARWQV
ncbi:MAG: sugar ABC transporter permease [Rhodospirillaceae bacterium]|nr:sugar ABC transporter permease [Rhodospirillaceae bacterium]